MICLSSLKAAPIERGSYLKNPPCEIAWWFLGEDFTVEVGDGEIIDVSDENGDTIRLTDTERREILEICLRRIWLEC